MLYYSIYTNSIQSTPFPGAVVFPEKYLSVFYPTDKRAAGFVDITVGNGVVTSCTWNEEKYQKWCAENQEQPEPEQEPTLEDRVKELEAQNKALTQSNQFLEDCLVDMAGVIYA